MRFLVACLMVACTIAAPTNSEVNPALSMIKIMATDHAVESDSCEPGWSYFSGNGCCYKSIFSVNYYVAWSECANIGGYLTSIHNDAENAFISELTKTNTSNTQLEQMTLIGMFYIPTSNKFAWADGSPVDYVRWAPKEPRYKVASGCVLLSQDEADERWYSQGCNEKERVAVCKKTK